IELMHAVEDRLGVILPMASFLQSPSVAELVEQAMRQLEAGSLAETKALHATAAGSQALARVMTHPLSHGQQALWLISRMAPESAVYNVPSAARVRGEVDAATMRRAFQTLVNRHAALRTTFKVVEGTPIAFVSDRCEVGFEFEDASAWDETALREHLTRLAHRPFDVEDKPPVCVPLLKRKDENALMLVMHHIVIDFWSLAILARELGELYEAERHGGAVSLPPVLHSYSDYVSWQAQMIAGPEGLRQLAYWERQLGGDPPLLSLHGDRPRPPVQTYRGASYTSTLGAELTHRLKALGRSRDATTYMTLLAVFQSLLSRYTGQEDILVGSPAAGRTRAAFSGVVGYFVNLLALRTDLSGSPNFMTLLDR